MSFYINPSLVDRSSRAPAPPVRRDLPRHRQRSTYNPLTDLFNRVSADRSRKAATEAKAAPAKSAPARKRYTMKAVGTAARVAVRMQKIGREVGIARQAERQERAGNSYARMSGFLLVRDNLMNVKARLVTTSDENASRLAEIDQELASIKADKTENREVMTKLVDKRIIGGDLIGTFLRKAEALRQSSRTLKREAAVIRDRETIVEAQIEHLKVRIEGMTVATERPFNGGGKPDRHTATERPFNGGGKPDRETAVEEREEMVAEAVSVPRPLSPKVKAAVLRRRPKTPEVEVVATTATGPVVPPMVESTRVNLQSIPRQETIQLSKPVAAVAQASTFKGRASISPVTKERLSVYLNTVNKKPGMWLMGKKKVMAAEAKDLAAEMDFVTWMDTVRSDDGARNSFIGISGNKAKSNVMFTQLQKVVQRQDGTYEAGVERTHSPAERRASVEYFANEHNLDPTRLDDLMSDVSSADKKTRVARTRALTDYMIG